MKSYLKFLLLVLIPNLTIAQEFKTVHFLQYKLNNRTTYLDRESNPIKNRLESLTHLSTITRFTNQQPIENSILKQKLDSTFSSYVNFPDLKDKQYFRYNQAGQQLSTIRTSWDEAAQTYYNQLKNELDYDAKGNLIESIVYTGDALIWENSNKTELSYNANNQFISALSYNWNSSNKMWELISKAEISYDLNGHATLGQFYDWNSTSNQWLLASKTEAEFDSKGNLLSQVFFSWDKQWLFLAREEFTYNSFNQELSFVSLYWDDVSADWINDHKWTSEYNVNQQLLNSYQFSWDDATGQWLPVDKTEYFYDVNGNMTSFINYNRDQQNQQWIPFFKGDCTYNNQYSFNDLLIPANTGVDNDIYFNHMLTKVGYFEYNAGNWHNSDNVLYYYSGINITKTNNHLDSDIKVVPNPANNYFSIVANEVTSVLDFNLFDLNGKQIIFKKIFSKESISTINLAKGIYCFRIISDSKSVQSGKLVIN